MHLNRMTLRLFSRCRHGALSLLFASAFVVAMEVEACPHYNGIQTTITCAYKTLIQVCNCICGCIHMAYIYIIT